MTTKINSTSDVSISTGGRDDAVIVADGGDVTLKEHLLLSNSKNIRWRNTADDGYLGLTVTAADDLTFNGITLISDALGLIPLTSIENGGGGGGSGFTLALVSTTFTAATNTQYLVDTTSGAFTGTLPTGTAQYAVRFSDDQRTWGINPFTIQPAAGQRLDGFALDEPLICDLTGAVVQVSWDGTKWVIDSNVVMGSSGGSGSFNSITTSEKSYVTRPDNANADWTSSNVSLVTAATEVVSANLPESASKTTAIRITRVSGTTGYVRYRFVADPGDLSKKFKIQWYQKYAGTAGDYTIEMWSFTASDYSTGAFQHPVQSSSIPQMTNSGTFSTTFDTGATTQKYIEIRIVAVAGTTPLYISGVLIGPGVLVQGATVSEWIQWTPTYSGLGTVVSDLYYKRVGSDMHVMGDFVVGTVSGTQYFTLPSGLTLDASRIVTPKYRSLGTIYLLAATGTYTSTSETVAAIYDGTNADRIAFCQAVGAGTTGLTTGNVISSNRPATIPLLVIPISQWAGSGTVTLGPGAAVEYAATSGTWDLNSSTTVYGPGGQAIGGTLNAGRNKTVTWQYPIQTGDQIVVEASRDQITWVPLNGFNSTVGVIIPAVDSTAVEFSGVAYHNPSSTQTIVTFGRYIQIANDDAPTTNWPASNAFWRVRKSTASAPVGISAATQTELGLIKLSQIAGAGEKNYLTSGSSDSTGWVASGAGIAVSTETSAANLPENVTKTTALKILRASGTDYARSRFTLDVSDYGKKFKIQWNQKYAGTAGDYTIKVFSNTLSDYTGTSTELPTSSNSIPSFTGVNTVTFDTSNGTAPYIEVRVTGVTGTTALYLSGIVVGPGVVAQGAAISDAVAFTPSSPNASMTFGTSYLEWRRVASKMHIQGRFLLASVAAAEARLAIPGGYTVGTYSGNTVTGIAGRFARAVSTASNQKAGTAIAVSTQSYLTFSYDDYTAAVSPSIAQNANALWGGTDLVYVEGEWIIPIAEWAGSGTVNLGPGAAVEHVSSASFTTFTAYRGADGTALLTTTPAGTLEATTAIANPWQYAQQVSDQLRVEVDVGGVGKWVEVGNSYVDSLRFDGTNYIGLGCFWNASGFSLVRGKYPTGTSTLWSSIPANSRYRLIKANPSSPVGFGAATQDSLGLIKLSQLSDEKNYLIIGASDATGWTASGAGISVATENSAANLPENITKTSALKVLRASGTDYARSRFTLDVADYGKKFKIQWNQKYAGTAGDYTIKVFSNTQADYAGTSTELPTSNNSIPFLNGSNVVTFDTSNSTAPYIEVRVTGVAGTTALYLSGIVVGPGVVAQGAAVGDWQTYTPTLGASLTASVNTARWRRVGDSMEIAGAITASNTGAVAAFTISIPTSYTINSSALPRSAGNVQEIGKGRFYNASTSDLLDPYAATATTFSFVRRGTNNSDLNGNAILSGYTIDYRVTVPIAEWASSGTVNLGPGAQVEYVSNSSTSISATDTTSFAYGPSGSQIQNITTALNRRVRFQYPIQATDALTLEVSTDRLVWRELNAVLVINGAGVAPYQNQNTNSYGATIYGVQNSTDLDIRFGTYEQPNGATFGAAGEAWSAGGGSGYWRVKKYNPSSPVGFGVATPAASGLTKKGQAVVYQASAGQNINGAGFIQLNFATMLSDPGARVTNPSTAWRFTSQIQGWIDIRACIRLERTAGSWSTGNQLELVAYKNGVQFGDMDFFQYSGANGTTAAQRFAGSILVPVNIGDYVELFAFSNAGATVQAGAGVQCMVSAAEITST